MGMTSNKNILDDAILILGELLFFDQEYSSLTSQVLSCGPLSAMPGKLF